MGCFPKVGPTFPIWTKTYLTKARTPNLISHVRIKEPKFFASYEKQNTSPTMDSLIRHTYATIWLEEHNKYLIKRKEKESRSFKSDPLEKVRKMVALKKEKERKYKEEQEKIAARLAEATKKRVKKINSKLPDKLIQPVKSVKSLK